MSVDMLFHIKTQFWYRTSVKYANLYFIYLWPSSVSTAVTYKMRSRKIKSWIKYFSVNFIIILGKKNIPIDRLCFP